jgi:hypothetical protein
MVILGPLIVLLVMISSRGLYGLLPARAAAERASPAEPGKDAAK